MSPRTYGASDETYEVYDPPTLTTSSRQRQQQAAYDSVPDTSYYVPPRPASAQGSTRSLRRTSRLSHNRSASVDVSGRPARIEESIPVLVQPASEHTVGIAGLRPALSEAQTEEDGEDDYSVLGNPDPLLGHSYWPRRSTRVSPTTASAILWTLEEAIRKPVPFTPDWEEVNASMSELAGIPGSAGLGGNGRTQNGASRAAQGPVPVNPHPASGVRTPTDIMRQRRDREARKRAEQEAKDREQEEAERQQEARDKAQAPPYTAGVAGDRTSQRRAAAPRAAAGPDIKPDPRGSISAGQQPPGLSSTIRHPTTQSQMPGSQPQQASAPQPQGPLQAAPGLSKPPTQDPGPSQPQQLPRRVAFPHAFERWETLSSHWEGLTGYWIRKLEQNNEALERDPVSQQMARQVTDLSAAGANLFHAVVELQRLRASSERKFQRWFFDTRSEQERSKEVQADLERQLKMERQARAEAASSSQKAESDKARAEDLLKEMRRELQISKEEARRAWEELGRREQEERDRTNSLRSGEPTLVGGVQVVPMIQGLPNRQTSAARPQTRENPYAGGEGNGKVGVVTPEGHYYDETPASPTGTDPFTEGRRGHQDSGVPHSGPARPPATTAAEAPGQYAGHYYDQGGAYQARPSSENDDRSYVASSEPGEEEYGAYRRNPQGQPIVYPRPMSEESDEYEQGSMDSGEGGYMTSTMPPTSGSMYAPSYGQSGSVDYSGSGWGSGWDSVTPRHRHPTRLSDVLEEEEPRTTPSRASRASQASRSVH